jgi:GAF domain-containing protein
MQPAPVLANEQERLAVLRALDVMDPLKEARFQRLASMARTMCDADIGLITLLDETQQWFKACMGLSIPGTERSISFCGHAIASDQDVFEVPDALADDRFADNPLVTGPPFIRFYAGAPIRITPDIRLGTLCVIHTRDVYLTQAQKDCLRSLADVARDEFLRPAAPAPRELQAEKERRGLQDWLRWLGGLKAS